MDSPSNNAKNERKQLSGFVAVRFMIQMLLSWFKSKIDQVWSNNTRIIQK